MISNNQNSEQINNQLNCKELETKEEVKKYLSEQHQIEPNDPISFEILIEKIDYGFEKHEREVLLKTLKSSMMHELNTNNK